MLDFPSPTVVDTDDSFLELDEAARLALVKERRLARWVSIGVVTPSRRLVDTKRRVLDEGFSLGDVGYLHLLHHLRTQNVPLRTAVEVVYHLFDRFGPPGPKWREASVHVTPEGVVGFAPDEWSATLAIPGKEGAGQKLALEVLGTIIDPEITLERLLIPAEFLDDIELNSRKENGFPVIRGTRLRTSTIRRLADLHGTDVVIRDYYDHITPKNIEACRRFEEYLDKAA